MCDQCNDFAIYEPFARNLDHQAARCDKPMFKLLKRLLHRPQETPCNLAEERNLRMDTNGGDHQMGRTQMNQNRPPHGFNRQPGRTKAASILCCLCHHGSEDSLQRVSETCRSPPELRREYEDRIDDPSPNVSRRLDFSMTPSPPHIGQEHSKISFHREEDISNGPPEILFSVDSGSSSKQTSDTEFFDAREYFSNSDSENDSHESSTLRRTASILQRCTCMTCTSVVQELGCPINYRVAEVCDAGIREKTKVRVSSDVRVAKYDIRSGNVMEEWVEEVNLSEEVIPIGYLKNTDMEEDAHVRRSRARLRLKNLFGADKRVRVADFGNFYSDEGLDDEGIEEFAPFDGLGNIDGLEPLTARNPGMR